MEIPKLTKPKLKKPKGAPASLKAPKVVTDLYADLRDRRLLPLIAVLAVAIAAVPFLLADDSSPPPAPAPVLATVTPTAASFSVTPAKQELRDYRKRLQHRKRESPFSAYAAVRLPNDKREEVEGVIDAAESGTTEVPASTGAVPAPTTEPSPPVQSLPPTQPPIVKATVKANVGLAAVIRSGYVDDEAKEAAVEPQTKLPKPEKPVVVYTGPSQDEKGALFLMSTEVSAYYGHGKCVLGGQLCQVLELRPGKSATFAVGYGETRYKVAFLGFAPIVEEETIERGD